jgi:hypothetical protein
MDAETKRERLADLGYIQQYAKVLQDNPGHPDTKPYLQRIIELANKVFLELNNDPQTVHPSKQG